jgi:hypothetical protein
MTVQQLLAEQNRNSTNFGPFAIAAGVPQNIVVTFPSAAWADAGHTMNVLVEKSFDGGVTWTTLGGFDGESGHISKSGVVESPAIGMSWDGRACQVRVAVTVNAPFAWGATVTTA